MKTIKFVVLALLVANLLTGCASLGIQTEAQQNPAQAQNTPQVIIQKETVVFVVTATPESTKAPIVGSAVEVLANPGTQPLELPAVVSEETQSKWAISYFDGSTDQMKGWFSKVKDPVPALWPRFPNVDNPAANFVAADGLEYGLDESVFMEQNEFGQMPVQARGYRLITGDYNIPGLDICEAKPDTGCAIAIFNVGEVTADFKAWVRQGFTVPGRYWNGDTLEVAIWALSSHVSANMLNLNTYGAGQDTLNDPNRTNAGANCSVPDGCDQVRFVVAITSGNQLLVKAITIVK